MLCSRNANICESKPTKCRDEHDDSGVGPFHFHDSRTARSDDIQGWLSGCGLYIVDFCHSTAWQSVNMFYGQRQLIEFHALYCIPLDDIACHYRPTSYTEGTN